MGIFLEMAAGELPCGCPVKVPTDSKYPFEHKRTWTSRASSKMTLWQRLGHDAVRNAAREGVKGPPPVNHHQGAAV
jgi:hypothetical protein